MQAYLSDHSYIDITHFSVGYFDIRTCQISSIDLDKGLIAWESLESKRLLPGQYLLSTSAGRGVVHEERDSI